MSAYRLYAKREEYSEVIELIDLVLADATINGQKDAGIKALILKSKYGYSDKIETVNTNQNNNVNTLNEEDKERYKQELKEKFGIEVESKDLKE
jgi:hypothetical protein